MRSTAMLRPETVTGLREMRQVEFVNMLLSQPVGATPVISNYMRMGVPASTTVATASLEQQRLRGWVGPDEFRARGVEIELGNSSQYCSARGEMAVNAQPARLV